MTYAYPQENSKSLKLTLPQSLADELDRIAQERFTSRLGLIRFALSEWISDADQKHAESS